MVPAGGSDDRLNLERTRARIDRPDEPMKTEGLMPDFRPLPGAMPAWRAEVDGGGWRLQLPAGPPSIQRIRLYRHN